MNYKSSWIIIKPTSKLILCEIRMKLKVWGNFTGWVTLHHCQCTGHSSDNKAVNVRTLLTHICNLTLLSCLKTVFTLKSIPTVLTKAEVKESSAYLGGEMMSADLFTHLHYHLTGIGRKFCPPSCCLWSTVWTCNQSSGLQRLSAMIVLPLPSKK